MQTFFIKNLDCAACANKIEQRLRKTKGVRAAHISFATNTLSIDCDDIESIKTLIKSIEPEVEISKKSQASTFLTPQLFLLLGLIALFLASLAVWHWWLEDLGEVTNANLANAMLLGIKILWIAIYLISGRNVIKGAVRSFRNKEFFDENVLMLTASIAAFCIGEWEEAVSIMLFFATGEYLQEISVKKSKEAISDSANLVPSIAHKVVVEGNSSLGMQCESVEDFARGTDAKSANLSQNPQSYHSHTANTRILESSDTESFDISESSSLDSQEAPTSVIAGTALQSQHRHCEAKPKQSNPKNVSTNANEAKQAKGEVSLVNTRILESNDTESRANTESFDISESNTDSIQGFAQSNNACEAPESRPCRGVKNALRKCRSAFLAFLTRQGYSEALPLIAEKKKRRFILFGAKGSGVGINPFSFCDNKRFKESRKYSLQLDSKKENLKNKQIQNLDCHESANADSRNDNMSDTLDSHKSFAFFSKSFAFFSNDNGLDSQTNTESSHLDSINRTQPTIAKDESLQDIDPKELQVGDTIILYAGEMLPCDATLLEDSASFNAAAISGESLPIESKRGDEILSGAIALNKAIKLQVLRPFEQSQIAQIADLIANATMQKSPTENFITTFARYYTPIVFALALLIALIPPLFFAQSFEEWIYRALVVLMVSCPCALVISVPIGYFGGLAAASKRGALIKGSNYLEALSKLSTIAFDKTGTLTKGVFEVIDVCPSEGLSKEEVLCAALCAQNLSNHPIAQSIKKTYQKLAHNHHISEYEELSGLGVRAVCDNHEIIAGNDKILHTFDIAHNTCYVQGSVVHIVRDKQYLGYILIADVLKDEASDVIVALQNLHIDSIMLSGDGEYPCKVVADRLGCAYYHSLLPQDKTRIFGEIKAHSSGKVAFVGDGINDAPSLALADVGIAMGSGSDISHKSADVIITNNSLQTLLDVIQIAKKTKMIIYQNIAFALGVKGVFIALGLFGLAGIWEAVFADVGVALLALANAMRCMRG